MEILHSAISWHWFCQVTAMWHVSLKCDMWLWDDMPLKSPVAAPCNVTRSSGIMTLNSPGGSTLQCGRWLWDDMPLNSPKRQRYWNSTCGLEFHHITAVDMSFCTSCKMLSKSDHLSRKQEAQLSLTNRVLLVCKVIEVWQKKWRHVDFEDGWSQPSWILGVQ